MLLSFLIGGIPFGLWITPFFSEKKLQETGSGNIGATNVTRVAGRRVGLLVFILDFIKGLLPPLLVIFLFGGGESAHALAASCGFIAVLGHCFSPFNGFQGGKGVSTSLGAMIYFIPLLSVLLPSALIFAATYQAQRTISSAILIAFVSASVISFLLSAPQPGFSLLILLTILIIIRHRENLERILENKEFEFKD